MHCNANGSILLRESGAFQRDTRRKEQMAAQSAKWGQHEALSQHLVSGNPQHPKIRSHFGSCWVRVRAGGRSAAPVAPCKTTKTRISGAILISHHLQMGMFGDEIRNPSPAPKGLHTQPLPACLAFLCCSLCNASLSHFLQLGMLVSALPTLHASPSTPGLCTCHLLTSNSAFGLAKFHQSLNPA